MIEASGIEVRQATTADLPAVLELYAQPDFLCCLLLADCSGEPIGDLCRSLREILSNVIEHLCAIVRCRPGPGFGLACRFHRVADVLAIAERRLTE